MAIREGHTAVSTEWNHEFGRRWAAERAAYLRVHGLAAEVARVDEPCRTYHATVPEEAEAQARDLVQDFERKRQRHLERVVDGDPCAAAVRFGMSECGGKAWFAWLAVFAGLTSLSDSEYAVWAYEVGGEAFARYRDLFRRDRPGPGDANGFTRSGAAWVFDDCFSGLSAKWLEQEPGTDWCGFPKKLWLIGEEALQRE